MSEIRTFDSINHKDVSNKSGKRILAQVLAGSAISMMILGLGAAMNVSTILIASISLGSDSIKASDTELSWLGSVGFICQPLGSLVSGALMEPIGRKKALIAINIPTLVAWTMTWWAQNMPTLFAATALMGLATGLLEAPTIAYSGEICEPSMRGIILSYSTMFSSLGLFGVYFLGTVLAWRQMAAVCVFIPLFTIGALLMMFNMLVPGSPFNHLPSEDGWCDTRSQRNIEYSIPESPIWLMSKGRNEDALKSLCWLRGWVDRLQVQDEFDQLGFYVKNTQKCRKCKKIEVKFENRSEEVCSHKETSCFKNLKIQLKELSEGPTLRPLVVSSLFFAFSTMTGFYSIRPNMINVFKAFDMPVDAHWATVGVALICIGGSLLCCSLVRTCGKRPIVLCCMAGSCVSTLLLAKYAYDVIPISINTYSIGASQLPISTASYTPIILFVIMVLCNGTGIYPVTWIIVSEIFPYKIRGHACGLVAALSYVMTFIATKTYIDVERAFHIYGAFIFYSVITFIGFIYLYLALPETEKKSQEEIESNFANNRSLIFADDFLIRRIKRLFKTPPAQDFVDVGSPEKNIIEVSSNRC